jgi:hypothetical protein
MERRKFTREFKEEAVRLNKERGVSYAQASQDLEVHQSQLRSWVKMLADELMRFNSNNDPSGVRGCTRLSRSTTTCAACAPSSCKLEETIKSQLHRGCLRRACHVGRQPPKADRSLLHDQQRQPRQRLAPCRRQTDVFGYRPG